MARKEFRDIHDVSRVLPNVDYARGNRITTILRGLQGTSATNGHDLVVDADSGEYDGNGHTNGATLQGGEIVSFTNGHPLPEIPEHLTHRFTEFEYSEDPERPNLRLIVARLLAEEGADVLITELHHPQEVEGKRGNHSLVRKWDVAMSPAVEASFQQVMRSHAVHVMDRAYSGRTVDYDEEVQLLPWDERAKTQLRAVATLKEARWYFVLSRREKNRSPDQAEEYEQTGIVLEEEHYDLLRKGRGLLHVDGIAELLRSTVREHLMTTREYTEVVGSQWKMDHELLFARALAQQQQGIAIHEMPPHDRAGDGKPIRKVKVTSTIEAEKLLGELRDTPEGRTIAAALRASGKGMYKAMEDVVLLNSAVLQRIEALSALVSSNLSEINARRILDTVARQRELTKAHNLFERSRRLSKGEPVTNDELVEILQPVVTYVMLAKKV